MTLGLETGQLSSWLAHGLRQAGLTVVCLDARAVHVALSTRINKNDRNDAEGLTQILRLGWYRPVHVKSYKAHRVRAMLGARAQLVGMVVRLSNQVRGILKVFGIVVGGVRGAGFGGRVEELVAGRPEVAEIVRPLLEAWRVLRGKVAGLDTILRSQARTRADCRLLMTDRTDAVTGRTPVSLVRRAAVLQAGWCSGRGRDYPPQASAGEQP